MKKIIEYFCENCNQNVEEKDTFTNSFDNPADNITYCIWCGSEVEEVDSYLDFINGMLKEN